MGKKLTRIIFGCNLYNIEKKSFCNLDFSWNAFIPFALFSLKMTVFSKLARLEYLPGWLENSPVFRALDDRENALVWKDFLPVKHTDFHKKHHWMKKDEINFLYFIHNLRMVDFWEIPPSEYPFCLFTYFYYNSGRNYREEIPTYLLEKLAKHSFGCYVGLPIEWRNLPSLAAEMGNIQFLDFLKKQRLRFNEYTFQAAASCGQMAVCQYLLDEGCKMNGYTIAAAGSVEVLEFLLNEKPSIRTSYVVTNAAKLGDMEMVAMAHKSGCKITMWAVEAAIKGDHLEIFKYFLNNGICLNGKIKKKAYDAFLEHRKMGIVGYIRDEMQKKMHAEKPVEDKVQGKEFDGLFSGGRL